MADRERFYDTLVEVIDPSRECVVASRLVEPYVRSFAAERLVASYRQDDAGFPFIDVWEVSLRPMSGGRP